MKQTTTTLIDEEWQLHIKKKIPLCYNWSKSYGMKLTSLTNRGQIQSNCTGGYLQLFHLSQSQLDDCSPIQGYTALHCIVYKGNVCVINVVCFVGTVCFPSKNRTIFSG